MPMSNYTGPARHLKSVRVGKYGIIRQHEMSYWYYWGPHSFDIREIRVLLDAPEYNNDVDRMPGGGYGDQKHLLRVVDDLIALANKAGKNLAVVLKSYAEEYA